MFGFSVNEDVRTEAFAQKELKHPLGIKVHFLIILKNSGKGRRKNEENKTK